ncbi:hypothetical protein [Rathayibacter sp. AY2B5]|uniref:hypothetical protein n=1 Tax=Rathayibacter sp. AY2B5 TaxID=2080570 RepID=UPI000CE88EB9|nr:hypothetical protein [Rathayibacter sp. AY2B5]PPG38649.1 hypothetical protein C5C30_11775 [Rathayibacter sp. AY2B5]
MSLFDISGGKSATFNTIGETITGTITRAPSERQATKYKTTDLDFWPSGDPKMQIQVPLQTTLRVDPDDDGVRTLYVTKSKGDSRFRAIAEAIAAAGAGDLAVGGILTVTYTGNDPQSQNPANPKKLYTATYAAPASGFAQPAPAAAPQQQQAPAGFPSQAIPQQAPQQQQQAPFVPQTPPPAGTWPDTAPQQAAQQQAPQPAAPAAAPVVAVHPSGLPGDLVEKIRALIGMQIPDAGIASATGVTPEQVAAVRAS